MSGLPSSLPGIDVAEGLARIGGNVTLYVKLLRKIANDTPAIRDRLSAAIVEGDAVGAKEAAHSLKGAASNLSIVTLTEAAAQLEAAAGQEDFSAMFSLLDALDKAIDDYVQAIEGLNV